MAFPFDPRGDLPPPMIQPTSYLSSRPQDFGRENPQRSMITVPMQSAPAKIVPCYDWIFSSASNVHVAIDRSIFKTYTSFKSYVLAIADGRKVKVRGVGTVELKIRCQPGSRESHTITLENVLHVPSWLCNIFSDLHFIPSTDFEHTWTDFGVSFLKKEYGILRYWGFTEGFMGLERLVLSKMLCGRSPMLDDKDREVFSVSVSWPQGQRDKWEAQVQAQKKRQDLQQDQKQEFRRDVKNLMTRDLRGGSLDFRRERRSGLTEISGNTMGRGPSMRSSSLKAPTSSHGSFAEAFPTRV